MKILFKMLSLATKICIWLKCLAKKRLALPISQAIIISIRIHNVNKRNGSFSLLNYLQGCCANSWLPRLPGWKPRVKRSHLLVHQVVVIKKVRNVDNQTRRFETAPQEDRENKNFGAKTEKFALRSNAIVN